MLWLQDELGALFTIFEAGHAFQLVNNETAAIRIRDMRHDRDRSMLHLLFNYSDKNVTDPVFEDLDSGALRTEPKLEGEGVAVSAHMSIDLTPTEPRVAGYRAVLEDVPGIGRSKITPFLTALYRQAPRIQWAAPDGSVKTCRPMFEILGRMSDTLRNDLAEGRLSLIELVQHRPDGDMFDEEAGVREEVVTVRLSVDQNNCMNPIELLNRVRRRAHERGFPNMRVRWTHGRQKTTEFGTAREDAGDVLVFRSTKITSADPLAQCEEQLREQTVESLADILLQEREQTR